MLTPTGDMDLRKIGQARNTLMNVKLSQVRYLDLLDIRYNVFIYLVLFIFPHKYFHLLYHRFLLFSGICCYYSYGSTVHYL